MNIISISISVNKSFVYALKEFPETFCLKDTISLKQQTP